MYTYIEGGLPCSISWFFPRYRA